MRVKGFEWEEAVPTAAQIRGWSRKRRKSVDIGEIFHQVVGRGDEALLEGRADEDMVLALTNRFDAKAQPLTSLRVEPALAATALRTLDTGLRESLELAATNVAAVAKAQQVKRCHENLPQGQSVILREVPVASAGVYVPGGKAIYPSSVLMCTIPAREAGVERIVLASPPGTDGDLDPLVLAAAALCEIDEIYAMGGAQAIFALAYGTATIAPVNVVAGPGNEWVREAKRAVSGLVGIDSLAGPSELMVVAGADANGNWVALDLCAQAEHGDDGPLVAVSTDETALRAISTATQEIAAGRPAMTNAPLALVHVPGPSDAIDLANAFAPEHLELLDPAAAAMADEVTTAGCVFVGPYSATAFGDYVAGSNHVLPTGGAGRFSGPLGPDVFRRKIATVEVPAEAAAKLAPHVDRIARAEGFPVHGESAMIRAEEGE